MDGGQELNALRRSALGITDAINWAVDRVPGSVRRCAVRAADCALLGIAAAIPVLYGLSNADASFLGVPPSG